MTFQFRVTLHRATLPNIDRVLITAVNETEALRLAHEKVASKYVGVAFTLEREI